MKKWNEEKVFNILILAVFAIGILVRCYKFGILMDSTQSDEMGTAYDAWCLLNYGTDRYGKSWPVYFNNYGVHGQSALMTYLSLISFAVFGYGKFALRFPALIVSALAGIFGILIVGETTNKNRYYQLVFAALYAVSPYTIMASRFALDCNLMFGISTIFLYFLIRAYKTEKKAMYFVAGLFAGLTLYTYSISYIVMPIMLAASLAYMCYTRKVKLLDAVSFVIPLAVLATPLILVQVINMFELEEFKIGAITIIRISNYGASDVSFRDFFVGIIRGFVVSIGYDEIPYNTDSRFFTFYPMSIPFFAIGVILLLKRLVGSLKNREASGETFIAIWFLCEVLAAGLMVDPNVNRMNGIIFAVMYAIVIGAMWVIEKCGVSFKKINAKSLIAMLVCAVYLVYFIAFVFTYYTDIALADVTTSSMCPEAIAYVQNNELLRDKVIASNIPPQSYMATLLPPPEEIDENCNCTDDHYTCYSMTDYTTLRDYIYNQGGTDKAYLVYRPSDDDFAVFAEMSAQCVRFGYNFYLWYWE